MFKLSLSSRLIENFTSSHGGRAGAHCVMSVNHKINLTHKHMHGALQDTEHFVSETLQSLLTLKARQVSKCSAGSGPAPRSSDLRGLGSPPASGVRMPLLPAESHEAALPQQCPAFRYHGKLRIFLFLPSCLSGGEGEVLES